MRNARAKDIFRTISHSKKRFLSIVVICILGVTMFSGLSAACSDLRKSADAFFDASDLHDLRVVSTMGLTDRDLEALEEAEGISSAVGVYGTAVTIDTDRDGTLSGTVMTIPEDGTDALTPEEGVMPGKAGEAAVTDLFLKESGLSVGDTFRVGEDQSAGNGQDVGDDSILATQTFTITAKVLDPTSVNNPNGSVSYRDAGSGSYSIYVTQDSIRKDGDTAYLCALLHTENTKELLCYSDAYEDAVRTCRDRIEEQVMPIREKARTEEIRQKAQDELDQNKEEAEDALASAKEKLDNAGAELDRAKKQLDENEETIDQNQKELDRQAGQFRYVKAYLSDAEREEIQKQLDDGQRELEEGRQKLAEARSEWEEGVAQYEENLQKYEEEKEKADTDLLDAQEDISDMDGAVWYVQTRNSMSGYANIGSDADSIQAIANVFPVVFFVVAVLMSLTTVTRMVEEERGLIGTYKALGFRDSEIQLKYSVYSLLAGIAGSVIGTVLAFAALPSFIFTIFRTMYLLPEYTLFFDYKMGVLGPAVFILGVLFATRAACRGQLRQTPAALMRPAAPRPGMRTLLERMPFIWNRLSFLGKVTARNIFRYKKRMFMTICGVVGCMALLLFGFGIRDSVHDLKDRQYGQTIRYDFLAAAQAEDDDLLLTYAQDPRIADFIRCGITSGTVSAEGSEDELSLTLVVFPDYSYASGTDADIGKYLTMRDADGSARTLGNDAVFVTRNAGNVLGFSDGDTVHLQLQDLSSADLENVTLIDNYLGNYIYMRSSTYEKYFGDPETNGILAVLSDDVKDPVSFCEEFGKKEGVVSCIGTKKLADSYSTAFGLINVVVYIIILMSAALAFTVLFTLHTTNISERERELATIKVLGFYDPEVHQYVNRESLLLTGIGILAGIPLGYAFAQTLTSILNLPSIYLAVSLHRISYAIAAGLSFGFALVVDLITNRVLDAIDPVTALKSVE